MAFKINFIFVGPQRTGTTWVFDQLSDHPGLCFPKEVKETFFFDRHYIKGMDWYEWHFKDVGNRLTGEVGPSYFDVPEAVQRIHALNPDCKIIITLRDPAERTVSLFHHQLRKGRVGKDFSKAIGQMPRIVTSGKYSEHIPRWIDQFGKSQVLILLLDDIKTKPAEVLQKITSFLEVSERALVQKDKLNERVNSASLPASLTLAKYAAKLSLFLKSKRLHKVVELGKSLGFKKVFEGGKGELPSLTKEEKKKLNNLFAEDVDYVKSTINRDLNSWNQS